MNAIRDASVSWPTVREQKKPHTGAFGLQHVALTKQVSFLIRWFQKKRLQTEASFRDYTHIKHVDSSYPKSGRRKWLGQGFGLTSCRWLHYRTLGIFSLFGQLTKSAVLDKRRNGSVSCLALRSFASLCFQPNSHACTLARSVHHHNTVRAQEKGVPSCCPLCYRWKIAPCWKKKKETLSQNAPYGYIVVSSFVSQDVTCVTWHCIACSIKGRTLYLSFLFYFYMHL